MTWHAWQAVVHVCLLMQLPVHTWHPPTTHVLEQVHLLPGAASSVHNISELTHSVALCLPALLSTRQAASGSNVWHTAANPERMHAMARAAQSSRVELGRCLQDSRLNIALLGPSGNPSLAGEPHACFGATFWSSVLRKPAGVQAWEQLHHAVG